MAKQLWTQEEIESLKRMYPDPGISPQRIEPYFGRSWKAIRLKAWKLGLNRSRQIDDQIHHAYFHEITTQEQAYWLGWLASDGYITVWNRGHYICLQLQARDESIIRRFIQAVAPRATICWDRKAVGVRIGSKELFHDLVAQGVELSEPTRAHKNKSPHLYKIRSSSRKVIHKLDAALNRSGLGLPRKHL